jgi:inorganic pyrophosphatase
MQADMVVEIPAGSRNKYQMDHEQGTSGWTGPCSPRLCTPPTTGSSPGRGARTAIRWMPWYCWNPRPFRAVGWRIGVFWIQDEGGPDAKLLCVPVDDPRWSDIVTVDDLPRHLLNEISHFFGIYKDLEPNKQTDVRGWQDRASAESVLVSAQERYRTRAGSCPAQEA